MLFGKKEYSMPLKKYFEIQRPEYVYLQLTPNNAIRNYNSSKVAQAVATLHKNTVKDLYENILKVVRKEESKIFIKAPVKVSYFIYVEKEKVEFYVILPKTHLGLIKEKIGDTWKNITIDQVEEVPQFSNEAIMYQLNFKKEDALSLEIDKRTNTLLSSQLNIIDFMEEGDRVGIFYNFMPCGQRQFKADYKKTMQKIKNREPVEKFRLDTTYILNNVFNFIFITVDILKEAILEVISGEESKSKDNNKELSVLEVALGIIKNEDKTNATKKKESATVLRTQFAVVAESKDKARARSNAVALCESYNSISSKEAGGNELIYSRVKGDREDLKFWKRKPVEFTPEAYELKNIGTNYVSIDECENLIVLPGRELLDTYKIIKKIDTFETQVPSQIQTGIIRAGVSTFKGKPSNVYHTEDKELKNTAICICGPNRSGKSTLFANMVYDAIKDGRTVILPDFCGKCQLSDEIAAVIPKEKILNINCHDWNTLQGFGYNEIASKDDSIFELYNCAKMKAAKVKELINLVNDGDNDLEGRMERYLEYAALIVFVCNGPVNDVFKALKDHRLRHKYIDSIPEQLKNDMEEYITELLEIDEWSKATKDNPAEVIGTKQGHIAAILSRVHRLKQNAYIELMLKKDTENNINLLQEIQKGKLICIRMYDSMFVTQQQKDIYVSYWITKIWGALQKRYCDIEQDKLVQTVILIDELYQTKNCEKYLTMILSQMPKYRTKLVLSCHHLGQIPVIQEELKSASCSYMFIAGSNKKNFNAMKEEFEDKGYSLEDLLHLKRYTTLDLLAYEDGYWAGITKLPPPIKKEH